MNWRFNGFKWVVAINMPLIVIMLYYLVTMQRYRALCMAVLHKSAVGLHYSQVG